MRADPCVGAGLCMPCTHRPGMAVGRLSAGRFVHALHASAGQTAWMVHGSAGMCCSSTRRRAGDRRDRRAWPMDEHGAHRGRAEASRRSANTACSERRMRRLPLPVGSSTPQWDRRSALRAALTASAGTTTNGESSSRRQRAAGTGRSRHPRPPGSQRSRGWRTSTARRIAPACAGSKLTLSASRVTTGLRRGCRPGRGRFCIDYSARLSTALIGASYR